MAFDLFLLLALGAAPGGTVAVQAGTIHLVENNAVIEGGGTILVRDGKIVAVGKDVAIPSGARVVDYGPDAVITPGLVSADSTYGPPRPGERTADPFLRGVDNFDPYASYVFALQEGVTAAYIAPARNRLIAGQGAVVKLAGSTNLDERVLSASCVIAGSVGADARNTPGYWRPPVPATSDIGLGFEKAQLPRSLMGAVVALKELFALAQGSKDAPIEAEYGPGVGQELRELTTAKKPWRITAESQGEIRAVLDTFAASGYPLIIDGANEAGEMADEIAKSGVPVIVAAPVIPNAPGRDFGKSEDARRPHFDTASKLAKAGVRFAISPGTGMSAQDLRFAAGVMSRGGLDKEVALRAITLAPAAMLGVADRIGSIAPGKDADFVVFSGHPLDAGADVIANWVGGDIAFTPPDSKTGTSATNGTTGTGGTSRTFVVHVDDLYLGEGTVLSPGEVLVQGGKIRAVGKNVGRPNGATVVHGAAAMPGMIDALGYLGLEGSTRVPATRFDMTRIVEPGDRTDRLVAKSGVTTVALAPRGVSRSGAPVMAYKPAGDDVTTMVVQSPCALRYQWGERNRRESGKALRETLQKAVEYAKKWREYEEKKAAFVPPKDGGKSAEKSEGDKKDADKKEGEGDKKDAESGDKKDDSDKKKDDDKKSKKKKGEEEPAKPITGAWETKITVPPLAEARMRLYVLDEDGKITGSLRCASLSDDLIQVEGTRDKHAVKLSGTGTKGAVTLEAETKDAKLKGKVMLGATKVDFEAAQTSTEYEIAHKSELRKPKEEKKTEIKGEPKAPSIDPELEPLRRAMTGDAAVIVNVKRQDEIVECVDAFEAAGIRPILYGADEYADVIDKLRDRVSGVLLTQQVVFTEPKAGAVMRNRYQELASAGIRVAFHSAAEEGAADIPMMAAYAVSQGLSPETALRALTSDAAHMLAISDRVGTIAPGLDADIVMLDGSPLAPSSSVVRVWVSGKEIR